MINRLTENLPFAARADSNDRAASAFHARMANETDAPESTLCPPQNPRPAKSKQHRRRHLMPGPAGLLFQQSHTGVSSKKLKGDAGSVDNSLAHPLQDDHEDDDEESISMQKPVEFNATSTTSVSFYSPAWMVMQLDLKFRTPSLPAHLSIDQKYQILRPMYPTASHYLIPDIIVGKADWNLSPKSLLVLVQASRALTDNLWTVSLMDETCATLDAWIQPSFVKKEQQQNNSLQSNIQPGLVWLVQDATVMFVANKDRKKRPQRMLLIKQENIQQVWTPAQADDIDEEVFADWTSKRDSLTAQVLQRRREALLGEDGGPASDWNPPLLTVSLTGKRCNADNTKLQAQQKGSVLGNDIAWAGAREIAAESSVRPHVIVAPRNAALFSGTQAASAGLTDSAESQGSLDRFQKIHLSSIKTTFQSTTMHSGQARSPDSIGGADARVDEQPRIMQQQHPVAFSYRQSSCTSSDKNKIEKLDIGEQGMASGNSQHSIKQPRSSGLWDASSTAFMDILDDSDSESLGSNHVEQDFNNAMDYMDGIAFDTRKTPPPSSIFHLGMSGDGLPGFSDDED